MAHRAFDAFVSEHARNPTAKELYFQQWEKTDPPPTTFDADFQKALDATKEMLEPAAKAILEFPEDAPDPIENPAQETTRPVPPNDDKAGAPEWYVAASKEIGVRETGNNSGPNLKRYRTLAGAGSDGDPWCAIFVNAMFGACNPAVPGTRSALARSFASSDKFAKLTGPALGAVVVFCVAHPVPDWATWASITANLKFDLCARRQPERRGANLADEERAIDWLLLARLEGSAGHRED